MNFFGTHIREAIAIWRDWRKPACKWCDAGYELDCVYGDLSIPVHMLDTGDVLCGKYRKPPKQKGRHARKANSPEVPRRQRWRL